MNNNTITARIIEVQKNKYKIMANGEESNAVLTGKLLYNEEYPVVGDYVEAVIMPGSDSLIVAINERKSFISRPDRSGHSDGYVKTMKEQAMIANVDTIFIATSLNDDFSVNRMLRYAIIVKEGGAEPVLLLTKADLCPNKEEYINKVREINKELPIICVSSKTGEGLDEVRKYLIPGKTVAMIGSSGVGKSTLMNTIFGSEVMMVSAIRDSDSKGRHTTTHRQLVECNGTYIIDTPGMRELGICDVEEGINEQFADIVELGSQCRFSNCSHGSEPGCAIRAALESGELSEEKWEIYQKLQWESNWAKEKKHAKMVEISKARKQLHKKK